MALVGRLRAHSRPARRVNRRSRIGLGLALLVALLPGVPCPDGARAQDAAPPRRVQVGLYVSPPFVMASAGAYSGMAIDLWEALAAGLDLEFDYHLQPTLRELVNATAGGEVDIAVTNLTITQARAKRIDFTQPWFDAGLRIMANQDQTAGFWDVVAGLRDSGHLRAYAWLALVILVATILLTVFDRHFDQDFPRRWRDGVAESFFAVMSVATSGRAVRRNLFGWIGRIWQGMWLACGVAVLAYVTSSVTSVMTTLALTNEISSLADLHGRAVGVFTGSVAEQFASAIALRARSFPDVDAAAHALLAGEVAEVVADAPVLEYYTHTHPDLPVSVVGAIFEPDKYGFGLAHRSALTHPLTVELLGAHESGLVDGLRARYFGDEP